MTLQEILKAKGMSAEDIEATIGEMKQNKIFTASEENLDIRYKKLKDDHDNLTAQYGESTKLIEQFKTGAKDNEALQSKITNYESTIADLTKQLHEQKIDAAMDRKLTIAGAKPEDFDYLKFQWRKKGEITLDDSGEVKGADDAIAGLKTQHPVQFASNTEQRELQVHHLGNPDQDKAGMTKAEFLRKPYTERVAFANENPDVYNEIMKH